MSTNEYIKAAKVYPAVTVTSAQMSVIPKGGSVTVEFEVDPNTPGETWSAAQTIADGAPEIFEVGLVGARCRITPEDGAQVVIL